MTKKYILGLAGYIGSGKSLAGNFFRGKGARFIDADSVVDDLYKPGREGYLKILNYFGPEFLTKKNLVNRKKLGKFVFADPHKLKILNFLIHPLVTSEIQKIIDKTTESFIVIEATYFEPKYLGKIVDAVLWIECEKRILMRRIMRKKNITPLILERVLRAQKKPDNIEYTVTNTATKRDFFSQLEKIYQTITKLA